MSRHFHKNKSNRGFRQGFSRNNGSKGFHSNSMDEDTIFSSDSQARFKHNFKQNFRYQSRGGKKNYNRTTNYSGPDRQYNSGKHRNPTLKNGASSDVDSIYQWYRIRIVGGQQYGSKDNMIKGLKSICNSDFIPIEFYTEGSSNYRFFVQGTKAKDALVRCSHQLSCDNGCKIKIMWELSSIPCTKITKEVKEKLQVILSNRYDVNTKTLNLSNFSQDANVASEGMSFPLYRTQVTDPILQIIKDKIPELMSINLSNNELRSLVPFNRLHEYAPNLNSIHLGQNKLQFAGELDHIKDLKLLHLQLDGNRLCDRYDDPNAYISAVRKNFAKIQTLDGHVLPPVISFDVEDQIEMPSTKGSYFPNDSCKELICRFVEQYFVLYDCADRKPLMDAYHDTAVFSLCVSTNKSSKHVSLKHYIDDKLNRNMSRQRGKDKCHDTLKCGKVEIYNTLSSLPRTKHYLTAFSVDVMHSSSSMLIFCVYGTYNEIDTASCVTDTFRSFTRTFITIPQGSGIVIINEELTISNASPSQISLARSAPPPATPSTSPIPNTNVSAVAIAQSPFEQLSPEQQLMLRQFSVQSGMNDEWSMKCLLECVWDFQKAAQVFTDLHSKGIIPPEAFLK